MEIKEAYKQKMRAQLNEWSAQIALLEAKADNAGAGMEIKRAEALSELRIKLAAATAKMHELEKSGAEAWEQVKDTADKVWDDLKAGLADAHSKFK